MGLTFHILLAIVLASGLHFLYSAYFLPPENVDIEESGWYGSGPQRPDDLTVYPFKVDVSEKALQDLKRRLESARIFHTHLEDSDNFWYGFNSDELEVFRKYWLNDYNWREYEAVINGFRHFMTEIEGLKVHFIHEAAAAGYKKVFPLLIVHGWPGNVFELHKIIPMLTDPKKYGISSDIAFEVVAPSIPGYGWSDQPKKTGFSQVICARVFRKLMERLNFNKFYLQGGDWGAIINVNLAKLYPYRVFGIHLNTMPLISLSSFKVAALEIIGTLFPKLIFSSVNHHNHSILEKFSTMIVESGYMHLQATKPDTVGTALNDSPIGLAAYILEKFSTWTNLENRAHRDGGLTKKFSRGELITIVMIYWLNGNIVSSQRFYREYFLDQRNNALKKVYMAVPTAHASGLNELFDRTPPEISSVACNLTHYTAIPDMGHFAALEAPQPLAADIFDFVNSMEK
uniref:Epoxide hydrolase n=1 Tax=Angiostrongylus cantonensis TaxID=6313 RepID=A0A0K0CZ45_ANGCA